MATIKHLAVRCRDLAQSRTFYETGLGFAFVGFRGDPRFMFLTEMKSTNAEEAAVTA